MSDEQVTVCQRCGVRSTGATEDHAVWCTSERLDIAELRGQLRNLQMAVERIEKALAQPGECTYEAVKRNQCEIAATRRERAQPSCTCSPPDDQDEACPLHGRDLREVVGLYRKCQVDLVEACLELDKLRDMGKVSLPPLPMHCDVFAGDHQYCMWSSSQDCLCTCEGCSMWFERQGRLVSDGPCPVGRQEGMSVEAAHRAVETVRPIGMREAMAWGDGFDAAVAACAKLAEEHGGGRFLTDLMRATETPNAGIAYCRECEKFGGAHHPACPSSCPAVKLTKAQRRFLADADICTPPNEHAVRHEFSGVVAKGSSRKCAAALDSLGLVQYVGHGPHVDEDHDKEWPVYGITDAGRAWLETGK